MEIDAILSEQPQEFHRFPLLPAEIRIKIWHKAFNTHRVFLNPRDAPGGNAAPFYLRSSRALLLVNQESRFHFLQQYVRFADTNNGASFYFNYAIDTLHVGDAGDWIMSDWDLDKCRSYKVHPIFKELRSIEVPPNSFIFYGETYLHCLPKLELISISASLPDGCPR